MALSVRSRRSYEISVVSAKRLNAAIISPAVFRIITITTKIPVGYFVIRATFYRGAAVFFDK